MNGVVFSSEWSGYVVMPTDREREKKQGNLRGVKWLLKGI